MRAHTIRYEWRTNVKSWESRTKRIHDESPRITPRNAQREFRDCVARNFLAKVHMYSLKDAQTINTATNERQILNLSRN